jgi:septation ring formation regulator EzrA
MKVTAGQLHQANAALGILAAQKLPIRASYMLEKNSRIFQQEYAPVLEQFSKVIRENGTPVEDQPGNFNIEKEKIAAVNEQLGELFATEIDAPFHQMKLSDLSKAEITAQQLATIEWLIVDDTDSRIVVPEAK